MDALDELEAAYPHVHAIVPRGGWDAREGWVPMPYVDRRCAELLFRHGVIAMLRDEGLLGQERIDLLMWWQANTGFSVHNTVTVEAEDPAAVERLARYLLRPPVSVERLTFDHEAPQVRYQRC
ncbi:MAG: transposase [Thermoanaerobaculia bacterium]